MTIPARTPDYHWIITIQYEMRDGHQPVIYAEGIITPGRRQTRQQVFRQIRDKALAGNPHGEDWPSVVSFFSLEPDELLPVTTDARNSGGQEGER